MKQIKNIVPYIILGVIVLFSLVLSLSSSLKESAIMDELAHIPAGYGYVRHLDYRLNPEHPPLVKALAAVPLLFQNLNFPTESSAWTKDINGQWEAGAKFLYESGNDADQIINWARGGPILLTLILIIFIYVWSRELMGRYWALIPAFLFSFSPTVLAHGHYVTTDVGATLGIFLATYYFVKSLFEPNQRNIFLAGIAFGIAQLMKFSAVLLIPFFIFLAIIFYFWRIKSEWYEPSIVAKMKKVLLIIFLCLRQLVIIFFIGYILVWLIYFIFTINYPVERQVYDTTTTLTSFAGGPDPNLETCKLSSNISMSRRTRCIAEINILMSGNRLLKPLAQYGLGVLMVMQRSSGGNTGYFLGEVSSVGWWYYFPVVFLLKEPIPSLLLILIALLFSIAHITKRILSNGKSFVKIFIDYLGTHFSEFSMISFVVLYWAYSIKSPLNIGIRHILPTIPFIYILSAGAFKKWFNSSSINLKIKFLKNIILALILIWYITESLVIAPHFISYFNQFGGGTSKGYQYVTDSNYDWGQDLKYLKEFVEKEGISKIAIDYFGGGSPKYYLGNKSEGWWSSKGNPKDSGIEWMAASINSLQGAWGKLRTNQQRNPQDEYSWLKAIKENPYEPDAKAGTSIFIYKLK